MLKVKRAKLRNMDGDINAQVTERSRWPIASLVHCLGWRVLQKLGETNEFSRKHVAEPIRVECYWSTLPVTLTIAFHSLTLSTSNYYQIEVHVEDVESNGVPLEIKASLVRIARQHNASNLSLDKGSWPPADPPIKATLSGNGLIGKVEHPTTRFLTVELEVFSLAPPPSERSGPILGGLDSLRTSNDLADVVLTVSGVKFSAHRAVLAASSDVFWKMFSGDFKEGESGAVVEVDVKDATVDGFSLFLRLMYTGQAADWQGLEVEVLELADRYLVPHIKDSCEARLMGMDAPTALGLLRNADRPVISSDVRVRAVQAVLRAWSRIAITPQWRDFQKACPVLADAIRAAQQLMPAPATS